MPHDNVDIQARIAGLVAQFGRQLGPIEIEIDDAIVNAIPSLGNDPAILTELRTHTLWTVRHFLAVATSQDDALDIAFPPETKVLAQTLVARGIELGAVYEAFRLAEQVVWQRWINLAAEETPAKDLAGVLRASHSVLTGFVEHVLHSTLDAMRLEQADATAGGLARRNKIVRSLLDGESMELDSISRILRHDMTRRHTALIMWTTCAVPPGALESASVAIARGVDAPSPLVVSVGGGAVWTWIATIHDAERELERVASDCAPSLLRVAVGPTLPGIEGFKRSHEGALAVQGLMTAHRDTGRISAYHDFEIAVLASQNKGHAREFVLSTLGKLADDNPAAKRLRGTLRVFLEEAENAPRAAERLHTHRNTVLQRVARATDLLGYPPAERRLAVELALELSHRIPTLLA
ncbi:PucR family transcriptional regulator [Rhodococcus sp. WS4]|nr:PucR family transcriptional regulator [Rhodococcus sp. WS4]